MSDEMGWWEQAPIVDVEPNRRVKIRRFVRLVGLVMGLARIWWPVLPVAVFLAVWGPLGGLLEGLVMAGVVVVSPRVRGSLRSAPMRSVERLFAWRWPAIASHAGLITPAHGGIRFPDLLSVGFGGRWWRPESVSLVLRVLPSQEDQGAWPKMARRLGIQLGYSLATPVVLDALRLEVRLRREVLPTMLELGADVKVDGLFDDPHRVPLGVSSLGGHVVWELDRPTSTSVFVGGGMGGGKSSVVNTGLGWFHRQLWLGRPGGDRSTRKGSGISCGASRGICRCARPTSAWRAINYVNDEMHRRAAILRRLKLRTWVDLPESEMARFGGRILLVVDELLNFFLWKGGNDKAAALRAKEAWVQLEKITSMGRALGVNVILATQHPIAEHLGPYGSTMIANTAGRIGIGALEPFGAKTLFKESGEAIAARTRQVIPGRMFVMALNGDEGSGLPMPAQAFFPSDRFVASLPELPAAPERLVHRFDRFADEQAIEVEEVLVG
ncbi:MAG: hypothetical protein R2761_24545 [Acidimicrobiales bacterium]